MNVDKRGVPLPDKSASQREILANRLTELERQALSLEEKAAYAEKEAQVRKRIQDAERRIRATQPPGLFDGLSSGVSIGGVWRRIPGPMKLLLVMGTLVLLLLLIGKSCLGSG